MKKTVLTFSKYLLVVAAALLTARCEDDPSDFGHDAIPDPGPDIYVTPITPEERAQIVPDDQIAEYGSTEEMIERSAGQVSAAIEMGYTGTDSKYSADQRPKHYVALKALKVMRFEVTVEQFRKFVEANPGKVQMPPEPYWGWTDHEGNSRENFPVVNVTWKEAKAFAEWVGGRLPTEAEWEWVAGNLWRDRKTFSVGNVATNCTWFYQNSFQLVKVITDPQGNQVERWGYMPHPVGSYKVSNYVLNTTTGWGATKDRTTCMGTFTSTDTSDGICDASGNVMEWCSDWFSPTYYQECADSVAKGTYVSDEITKSKENVAFDPKGPDSGDMKVLRGGSFLMGDEGGSPMAHRITSRQRAYPGVRDVQVGFRVVWDVE